MKPTLQSQTLSSTNRKAQAFPLVDCNYSVATLPNFRGSCARHDLPSFRNISREYFRKEARGEFQREGIAFALIVLTAAIPLLSNAHALVDFLRVIGTL